MTTASVTSGVAPLQVFFDVVGTAGTVQATTTPNANWIVGSPPNDPATAQVDWSLVDYLWVFRDTSANTWTVAGQSRNKSWDLGYMACHTFETAGVYRVELLAKSENGRGYHYYQDITVTDPEVVYAASTLYVDNTVIADGAGTIGDPFKNAATGFTALFASDGPRRLLFKKGGSWSGLSGISPSAKAGPYTIGSYGVVGAKPVLTFSTDSALTFGPDVTDLRLLDLEIVGPYNATTNGSGVTPARYGLVARCTIRGFADGVQNPTAPSGSTRKNVCVMDNDLTGNHHYSLYWVGGGSSADSMHIAVQGNTFDKVEPYVTDVGNSHMRTYCSRVLVQHNKFLRSHTGRGVRLMNDEVINPSGGGPRGYPTRYIIVSGNWFHVSDYDGYPTQAQTPSSVLSIEPEGTNFEKRVEHVIIERNLFTTPTNSFVKRYISCYARFVTIRDNIFDFKGSYDAVNSASAGACIEVAPHPNGQGPTRIGIKIHHNTASQPNATVLGGSFHLCPNVDTGIGNERVAIYNNVVYAPSATSSAGTPAGSVDAQANTLTDPHFTDASTGNFHLTQALAGCVDAPVRNDFDGLDRYRALTLRTRGVYEYP